MERLTKKENLPNSNYSIKGFYEPLIANKIVKKLGELEDIEQEIGIEIKEAYDLIGKNNYRIVNKKLMTCEIISVSIYKKKVVFVDSNENRLLLRNLNITWFLTKDQAEKKLEKLNGR